MTSHIDNVHAWLLPAGVTKDDPRLVDYDCGPHDTLTILPFASINDDRNFYECGIRKASGSKNVSLSDVLGDNYSLNSTIFNCGPYNYSHSLVGNSSQDFPYKCGLDYYAYIHNETIVTGTGKSNGAANVRLSSLLLAILVFTFVFNV
ncbi:hypothetical protein G9P44_002264 [Scheffersomyces stipitis]|nr:hypothetical protein G9P44_002264 [Scheffersomyces stipitis]